MYQKLKSEAESEIKKRAYQIYIKVNKISMKMQNNQFKKPWRWVKSHG
jgi:hypothetical protein